MKGIFLTDARDSKYSLTYSAREAVLHETINGLLLVMQDGLLQISNNAEIQLSTVSFDRLGLSLNEFFPKRTQSYLSPKEVSPLEIIYDFNSIDKVDYKNKNDYIAEAHLKLATPLTPIALTILALTTFLITGYKRKGFALPIYIAITIGLAMQASTLSLRSVISENNALFWTIYSPSALVIFFSLLLIYLTQKPKKKVAKV
jgi:lipopolysaccharide export system permease protein